MVSIITPQSLHNVLSVVLSILIPKGELSGLRKIMATESPFKIMKTTFYFTLKAIFVLEILKLLSYLFGHVEKRFDKKGKFQNV